MKLLTTRIKYSPLYRIRQYNGPDSTDGFWRIALYAKQGAKMENKRRVDINTHRRDETLLNEVSSTTVILHGACCRVVDRLPMEEA